MASLEIRGGNSLMGEVRVQGSKNAALPILSACLLARGETKLYNCPMILDVYNMIKILENMGCHTEIRRDCVVVDTSPKLTGIISEDDAASMRSSVMLMGAVLGREGYVYLPWPGGCSIGKRPVDLHLSALEKMNVSVRTEPGGLCCTTDGLCGNVIVFPYPSVGATENVILTAVLARGTTTICHAAKEPEIVDMCLFLNQMGAQIHGMGTSQIIVHGVKELKSISYTVMADRIVAGTYLASVAAVGGHARFYGLNASHLLSVLPVFQMMGMAIQVEDRAVTIKGELRPQPVTVETGPYPGFPTDLQSPLMAVMAVGAGESLILENVFEGRYETAGELRKLGAQIIIEEKAAHVRGISPLYGSRVEAKDLRGGAALVVAGLAAEGETVITGCHHIFRGYEDICRDLSSLGAQISKQQ